MVGGGWRVGVLTMYVHTDWYSTDLQCAVLHGLQIMLALQHAALAAAVRSGLDGEAAAASFRQRGVVGYSGVLFGQMAFIAWTAGGSAGFGLRSPVDTSPNLTRGVGDGGAGRGGLQRAGSQLQRPPRFFSGSTKNTSPTSLLILCVPAASIPPAPLLPSLAFCPSHVLPLPHIVPVPRYPGAPLSSPNIFIPWHRLRGPLQPVGPDLRAHGASPLPAGRPNTAHHAQRLGTGAPVRWVGGSVCACVCVCVWVGGYGRWVSHLP